MMSGKNRKAHAMKTIGVLLSCAGLLALACGCAKSPEKKAALEQQAAARAKVAELEKSLAACSDDALRIEGLREIIGIQAMESGDLDAALERYEKNESLLAHDAMSRIYVAVAQSMKAGREKKIENKLKWLRVGMNSFETLREEFPDDPMVGLYQASTYANFPPEVGAKLEVLDIISELRLRYASKEWTPSEGIAGQMEYIYSALERNFSDQASREEIKASRDEFASADPIFAVLNKETEQK
jgi:hypothetical protein